MDTLHILYTQNIRGKLEILPRLTPLIKQIKREAEGKVLLIDAGNCCDDAVELCAKTKGRAAIILIDAIGYDAANVETYLTPGARDKLAANYLGLKLVYDGHAFASSQVIYGRNVPENTRLHVLLETSPVLNWDAPRLTLQTLQQGQLGHVILDLASQALIEFEIYERSTDTPPDPTIAGTLEFIIGEANYQFGKKS